MNYTTWFSDLRILRPEAEPGWHGYRPAFVLNDDHYHQILDDLQIGGAASIWDRDIPRYPDSIPYSESGVYVWFESLDHVNIPIYVGQSGDLFTRLYSHYWAPSGGIYQYAGWRLAADAGKCAACGLRKVSNYSQWVTGAACPCICTPRYWLRLMACKPDRLLRTERQFIEIFNPILNIQRTDWQELLEADASDFAE